VKLLEIVITVESFDIVITVKLLKIVRTISKVTVVDMDWENLNFVIGPFKSIPVRFTIWLLLVLYYRTLWTSTSDFGAEFAVRNFVRV